MRESWESENHRIFKQYENLEIPSENNENHANHRFTCENNKNHGNHKIPMRIMQIMKIIEFHTIIMKIIEILKNQLENKTNHENL